jgi:hypothetical protein
MTATVLEFKPEAVGDNYRIDTDQILNAAIGTKFARLAILGETDDGEIYVAGSANAGETLVLMELAKYRIVRGE